MRVLDTETGQFVEIDHLTTKYAILSHTWDHQNGEQTYAELKRIQDRYILRPGARPQNNALHRQDNPFSAATSPDSPSSPTPAISCTPFPAAREAASTTTLPNERTALLAGGVGQTEGRLEDNAYHHDAPQSRLSGPWQRLLQFLRLIIRSAARVVKLLGDGPPADSISTAPEPVLAPVVVHDTSAPPVEESSSPPPASSPTSPVPDVPTCIWDDPELSPKIKMACAVAHEAGYWYIWIDSCCIDKASSSELSEAINSMYMWYGDSTICYAYLADVPPGETPHSEQSSFRKSRWFTRGWTLQELIAPGRMIFLSADWETIGSKDDLVDVLEETTGVDRDALLFRTELDQFSIARRFSWATGRRTERVEDQAYALMGIFDINMPTLYGEGERAFRRLQEEIMRRTPDQSLLAWGGVWKHSSDVNEAVDDVPFVPKPKRYHIADDSSFTASLNKFEDASTIRSIPHHDVCRRLHLSDLPPTDYTFTSCGIRTQLPVVPFSAIIHPDATPVPHGDSDTVSHWYLAMLGCEDDRYPEHLLGRVIEYRDEVNDANAEWPLDIWRTVKTAIRFDGAGLDSFAKLVSAFVTQFQSTKAWTGIYSGTIHGF
ncbi:HET-domain-containing protein [Dichomitus squalens]|uniref:HET-domain-containing protein n=1 Tax=Dichomitus squalens TaxID=114155 RepID=A0A4Q9NSA9_9APHY|nr:HET-domain-containing protein [Dichomitus squalens]TBU54846.1 HET-domain-containing protein [Dichomitus squalens]